MNRTRSLILLFLLTIGLLAPQVRAQNWFLRLEHDDQKIDGLPIHWDNEKFHILGRDGQLLDFKIGLTKNTKKIKKPFQPFTQTEMRAHLTREFGSKFDVTATGNYLVVHPRGESDKWPQRFEKLYREMLVYFGSRGIDTKKPQFPLVAVVLPDKASFFKYASSTGTNIDSSVLGYYTPVSNRIFLYDASEGGRKWSDWRTNAETLVHEAAHQTAYNVGLHKRLAVQPRWLTEGLGTLFEAPGVYDSGHHPDKSDRINRARLSLFKKEYKDKGIPKGTLKELIATDRMFESNPHTAYTLAWAMTFTLNETQPSNYARFLALNNKKKRFAELTPAQRLRDFSSIFGPDFGQLQTRVYRYVVDLE